MAKSSVAKIPIESFIHLDMLRGLAAILVLIGHLRGFIFVSYDKLSSHNFIDIVIWAISGFGHQAVMIFFVLSGFFITRSIVLDGQSKGFSWPVYLIKRLSRLWIVLLPALLLTLLWDSLGASVDKMGFYAGQLYLLYNSGPSVETGGDHLNVPTMLGNLFFLQTIKMPIYGSNGPLWSLSNEFWYYLMFPLLYVSAARWRQWLVVAANASLFVVICIFVGKYIVIAGIVWLAGAATYVVYDRGWLVRQLRTPIALFLTMFALLLSLVASKTQYGTDIAKDTVIGIAAAAFVLVLARLNTTAMPYRMLARILADGSYTVYLVHFPFMAFIATVILHNQKFDASFLGYALFFGLGIITLIYCYGIYWVFERQTGKVRRVCIKKYTGLVARRVPAK